MRAHLARVYGTRALRPSDWRRFVHTISVGRDKYDRALRKHIDPTYLRFGLPFKPVNKIIYGNSTEASAWDQTRERQAICPLIV